MPGAVEELLKFMDDEIRISVRDLVEFIYREGDIDTRTGGVREEAMLEGARMHRKLQREAGADYLAEVPLSISYDTGKVKVLLEGRADGIFVSEERTEGGIEGQMTLFEDPEFESGNGISMIDEIKTTYQPLSRMNEPVPVHLAQAKCYAFIYLSQNDLNRVGVRMTYCSLVTEKIRYFYEQYSRQEISDWFDQTMREYERWALLQIRLRERCVASAGQLAFPFPYREGQRDLIVHVYHTIRHGRKLFLEAPTGTGKTLCTVFPALKAIGEGHADKLFYLTSKTVTGKVALDAFALLREHGLHLVSVQLTAKERICPFDEVQCDPDHCLRAKGHFDRVNDALYDVLSFEENIDRDMITAYADKACVCPFELSLDASLFADAIIGDYNYVFDPHARLQRFWGGTKPKDRFLFLIDEAHNLVDRARDMYSASLSRAECRAFRKEIRETYPELYKSLGKLVRIFAEVSDKSDEQAVRDVHVPGNALMVRYADDHMTGLIADRARDADTKMQEILMKLRKEGAAARERFLTLQDKFLPFYFMISHFLMIYDEMGEGYVSYISAKDEGGQDRENTRGADPVIRLYCVDPSAKLAACMERGISSVLFSATFLPIQYYKKLLGGKAEDYEVSARSVFDPRRQGVFVASDVTSRYRDRTAEQFDRIARGIHSAVSQRHGNYLVFFPSYRFMDEVLGSYMMRFGKEEDVSYMIQSAHMTETERQAYLAAFEEVSDSHSRVGFAVLGGIFSEGIDLRRDRLIGVLVVGTGFPQVCREREVLKQYFDQRGENGFDYAYRFPGMNKVLQAAGRVIRTTSDVGIIVLMDERYQSGSYRRLFPSGWRDVNYQPIEKIGDKISRFWDEWL